MYTNSNFEAISENGNITITNRGAFVASCYLSYTYNGRLVQNSSPYMLVLQSFKFNIPIGATDIKFLAVMWLNIDFKDYVTLCKYNFSTPPTKCFRLWGSLFYAGCEELPCP